MSRPRARMGLLLEQAAEPPAHILRTHRPGGRVALDGHQHREERALVGGALVSDPLGDLLRALEAAGGHEVGALSAGVQLGLALRAARERVGGDRQHGAALGAARGRTALEDTERPGRLGRLAPLLAAAGGGASIALLPVLAVAQRISPAAGGGTSCTSSRSRSSRGRCVRSSPPSGCAARGPAWAPTRARRRTPPASSRPSGARPGARRATPARPPTR